MKSIIDILLKEINKRTVEQMELELSISEEAKEFLIDKGYDKKYGARPLKRVLQNLLEDRLAESILDAKVSEGDKIHISVQEKGDEKELVFQ